VLYAGTSDWSPGGPAPEPADRPALDRWALSEAHRLAAAVTEALERFDTQRVGTLVAAYVDDLSNWYVRRSRRRFWQGDPAALATLHECLYVVTLLMAPVTPFITERVWQDMFVGIRTGADTSTGLPESVHLAAWPEVDGSLVDDELDAQVRITRRIVELGRAARADAKVRTRQPLRRALIASAAHDALGEELRAEIADELNVGSIDKFSSAGELVDHEAKGNFRALGKRFANRTPKVAEAIAAADAARLEAELRLNGSATVTVEGQDLEVLADEVIISERPREGWSVVNEQGETVALDLELTDELRRAGVAREIIRMIQEARKNSGFDVSDRIALTWSAPDATAAAFNEHSAMIADEVLAASMAESDDPAALQHGDITFRFNVFRV
jgi:isoleucyl-tRNA synthetase